MKFEVHIGECDMRGEPHAQGPWIGRTYVDGEHLHSTEGGASLETCLNEASRAMLKHQVEQRP